MAGPEMAVGGWFASTVIRNLVSMGRSYLGNNAALNKETSDMLDELQYSLQRIQAMADVAERISVDYTSRTLQRSSATTWLRDLKDAAYSAEDVIDDFKAKEIKQKLKGKVGEVVSSALNPLTNALPSSDVKRLKDAVHTMKRLLDRGNSVFATQKLDLASDTREWSSIRARREVVHFFGDTKVIGRDGEIDLILDMILATNLIDPATFIKNKGSGDDKPECSHRGWIVGALRRILPMWMEKPTEQGMSSNIGEYRGKNLEMEKLQIQRGAEAGELYQSRQIMTVGAEHKGKGVEVDHSHMHEKSTFADDMVGVLPLVGIAGIGKTTIAQVVFNDERVKEHFDLRGWLYMPENIFMNKNLSEDEILLEVIVRISQSFEEPCTEIDDAIHSYREHVFSCHGLGRTDSVLDELVATVKCKRFLVVLDDVWDDIFPIWSKLKFALNAAGAPGSVVLVTTELHSVATFVATMGLIVLDALQEEHFWNLFKQHAFSGLQDKSSAFLELEPIGRRIADKLHGLPLASKIVGRSLSVKLDKRHWEEVSQSPWWNITKSAGGEEILASLGVSFYNLSAPHRRCFVYCSIFPRHYVFDMDRLIEMWVSHGFIPNNDGGNNRFETEQGRKWFEDLVDRSYLQPTVWKDRYIVHDAIRDFSVASSSEYCILNDRMRHVPQFLRHLSIDKDDFDVHWGDYDHRNLRTLLAFGHHSLGRTQDAVCDILKSSTGLRVLDLSNIRIGRPKVKFLNSIGGLLHLRYIDLSFSEITELPETFGFLCHLQVLDLRGCQFKLLPRKMNRLINIQHLRADAHTISLIYGIGQLTRLQELCKFIVKSKDGHRITELRDLTSIQGFLCISNLQLVTDREEALQACLFEKEHLRALQLEWNTSIQRKPRYVLPSVCYERRGTSVMPRVAYRRRGQMESSVTEDEQICNLATDILGAMSPPIHLEELKFIGYPGMTFPDWVEQLKYLRAVNIASCIELEVLPPLGHLEHLQKLTLYELPSIKDVSELYATSDVIFRSLEELKFNRMANWQNWAIPPERDFMPGLLKLQIEYSDNLREIPLKSWASTSEKIMSLTILSISHFSGILTLPCQRLRSLQCLNLSDCKELLLEGGLIYLRNLKSLSLYNCHRITTALDDLPDEEYDPTKSDQVMHFLTHLSIDWVLLSIDLGHILGKTPVLQILDVKWDLTLEVNYFGRPFSFQEQWLEQLTSLRELKIIFPHGQRQLSSNLVTLSSLRKLTLDNLSVDNLTSTSLPRNLKELHITCYSELEEQCRNRHGEFWEKISYIPYIRMNGRTMQTLL